jgi:uncharacterized protein YgbK (DUF1537 family)
VPDVLLIADDLTGAADSGVTFAKHGAEVVVGWGAGSLPDADVVVLSTESRHRSADQALQRVRAALAPLGGWLQEARRPWVYKKVDSTLRGHPGLELAALMAWLSDAGDVYGPNTGSDASCALVAPAFPAQGRTTQGGIQTVHGVPLAETVFGQEVATSLVRAFFVEAFGHDRVGALSLADVRGGPDALMARLRAEVGAEAPGPRVLVADAVTEADLRALADAALGCGLSVFCGSAGLAEALAERLADARGWATRQGISGCREPGQACSYEKADTGYPAVMLVVAASRHPQTVRQVEMLRAAGVPVLNPDALLSEEADAVVDEGELGEAVRAGAVVLTTVGLPPLPELGETLASALAEHAAAWMRCTDVSGLVLTGGDAAVAVSCALGAQALRLCGEVAPGLPWGHLVGGAGDGCPVVTKAGGFGEEDALVRAVEFLQAL